MIASLVSHAERLPLPDSLTRAGISYLVGRTRKSLAGTAPEQDIAFARTMPDFPIALHADAANAQHYEVPPAFFEAVLGPHRKYSCCYFANATDDLAQAEEEALRRTCDNAALADGQRILELGCGWGSLSLFMAARYPNARIVSVSNSGPQRRTIEALAAARGLTNLEIITADMNQFETGARFDRIVSVEMFEHMANWHALLARCKRWLTAEGRLFIHVFSHDRAAYRFDHNDQSDWIAQHFFTGGIMPSHTLAGRFPDLFTVEESWRWSGTHYARTARLWLENFDAHLAQIDPILRETYGAQAELWKRRWRLFFLATEGLFGHAGGNVWGVSHYRMAPAA